MPQIHFIGASRANYTVAHRPASAIRLIVIHVTESSAASAIAWFENPKAQASANYVVGQDGSITEMVPDSDIAWQAGNWKVNTESIGIEHGGYTYRKGSFTDAEYRSSARLVAAEMRHYLLPIDRRHIIGHYQVPDPNHPGLFGGFAHHTDPGPYWNWPLYMRYVKAYAHGSTPAPKLVTPAAEKSVKPSITASVSGSNRVSVASSGLSDGATVSGFVTWRARVAAGDVKRIEFLIDGRVVGTGTSYDWNTTTETNGAHVLTLRVTTKSGKEDGQSIRVTVANSPFAVASANLTNGATVGKTVRWEAVPSGATADHVDFLLDDRLVGTATKAPYLYDGDGNWDTTKVANGPHTLTLRAVSVDGRVAESTISVLVSNAGATPQPKPASSGISIVMNGLYDGETVSGRVSWTATTTGSPRRVDFFVDGRWRWSEYAAPWVFGGDGNTWDTSREKTGKHVVTVRAIAPNGSVADWQSFTITVDSPLSEASAPAATTMAVTSSIADGATVHGAIPWTATVNGATPERVDFFVDGSLRHTEYEAPYEFGTWDTTWEANGPHTLVVRATAPDGSTASATETVQVQNAAPTVTIVSQSLADGATVSGSVPWSVTTSGLRPDRVVFSVDGTVEQTATHWPYTYTWDTTGVANGVHTLLVQAIAGSQVDERTISVTVANAAQKLTIASDSLSEGQTLTGTVAWKVTTGGPAPDSVQLSVDGSVRATGTSYTWDTTKEADGTHTVDVKAVAGGQVAEQTFTVTVRNSVAVASSTIRDGQTVWGTKTWTVTTQGPTPDSVQLYVDGALRATGTTYAWDTTKETEGQHTLVARVTAGTQVVQATYTVTVANTPVIESSSIASGQTLSGTQTWTVWTSGAPPDRIEYWVDGSLRATGPSYVWDTTKDADGSHTLVAKAIAGSLVATKTFTVTVDNAPVAITAQSIADGATLSGQTAWTVAANATKVEFYVDGSLRHTDWSAPFAWTWDTGDDANGTHTLVARAYLGSQSTTATLTVTVSNAALGVTQSLTDGETVSGTIAWTATPTGSAARVQFLIDGRYAGTFRSAPYGGTLDTTRLPNGSHTFEVVATDADWHSVSSSVTVTVSN